MRSCIATLPIRPRSDPYLEFYYTPIIASVLASMTGLPLVVATNNIGRQKTDPNDFLLGLERLNIKPALIWSDDDSQHLGAMNERLRVLSEHGHIAEEEIKALICDCGAVEMALVGSERLGEFRVMMRNEHGIFVCKLCGSTLREVFVPGLNFSALESDGAPLIHSDYASREITHRMGISRTHRRLITRTRTDNPRVCLNDKPYHLDIDFAWSTFVSDLQQRGWKVEILVCSNHSFSQLVDTYLVNEALLRESPISEVVVTPYSSNRTTSAMSAGFSAGALRTFIVETFTQDRKDVGLNVRELQLAELSYQQYAMRTNSYGGSVGLDRALEMMKRREIIELMKKVYKGDALSAEEALLVGALHG